MIHKSPIVAQPQDIQAKSDVQAITVNLYVLLLEGNFFLIFCMRLIASSIALVSKAAMATCSYTSHTADQCIVIVSCLHQLALCGGTVMLLSTYALLLSKLLQAFANSGHHRL